MRSMRRPSHSTSCRHCVAGATCSRALRPAMQTPRVQACAQGGAPLARLGIAGGDTSSHAVRALAPWGLSYLGNLGPGVAVTRMHCDDPALDGLALMLKGGQMGSERVFEGLVQGTTA